MLLHPTPDPAPLTTSPLSPVQKTPSTPTILVDDLVQAILHREQRPADTRLHCRCEVILQFVFAPPEPLARLPDSAPHPADPRLLEHLAGM